MTTTASAIGSKRWSLVAGVVLACCQFALGEIVYTDVDDIPLFTLGEDVYYDLDFNQDAQTDALFHVSGNGFSVIAASTSFIGGRKQPPPDLGSFAAPFHLGQPIGQELPSPWSWNAGSATLITCRDIGCLGFWGSNIDYVGVQFTIDGNTHYGWVEVDVPFDGGVHGGYVRSFAYETEAGAPIIAGAIPEPSASVLILIGIGVAIAFHRSGKRRNKHAR